MVVHILAIIRKQRGKCWDPLVGVAHTQDEPSQEVSLLGDSDPHQNDSKGLTMWPNG